MVSLSYETIRDNILRTKERIAAAALRSGRTAGDITLVAVSKFQPIESLCSAVECGVKLLGESRVQEAEEKRLKWRGEKPVWHMIGHLQRNKARKALAVFDCIESLDSADLAEALERVLAEMPGKCPFPVFVQVNTSGELTKNGVSLGETSDLFDMIINNCPSLSIEGLMTIGPIEGGESSVRKSFSRLRELRDSMRESTGLPLRHLSMGMSGDFEWAIEEGSTFIRVGTGIFGIRAS